MGTDERVDAIGGREGPERSATIRAMVETRAGARPDAVALRAAARPALTYAALLAQMAESRAALRAAGVAAGDRVALVVPDGPEAATAFLAVAGAATCAPLNPRYQANELEFYLDDLGAAALVVRAGLATPAREVAARRRIPVLELEPAATGAAGRFRLAGRGGGGRSDGDGPGPGDVALALHTSGTTSRPKLVPLTHANLTASAAAIARTLRLSAGDQSLCVMPLFHIHGLVGVLLASLGAGAAVHCTGGFVAPEFLAALVASGATWYSAVPTMHQAILARAAAAPGVLGGHRLRFVRSSSAPLPPAVAAALERTFGVPVIEAYGMTEASHQMASNPLPPAARKPGSVGLPAGPEIGVIDAAGRILAPGERGEVVIRGPGVTRGYEANPEANARAFTGGWFRTGDEGYRDADGYLFLTGRLKEMINRGGEKIAPRELDEVLLAHPDVLQAVAFGAPHPALGEEVAAAVVLRPGASAGEAELQAFVAARVADFKVPRRIVRLPEIPKGPTGKLQRIGLAERLGVDFAAGGSGRGGGRAPASETERRLAAIWAEVLGVGEVAADDDFFALGGDSILAGRVRARVAERLGVELPILAFLGRATLAAVASRVEAARGQAGATPFRPIPAVPRGGPLPLSSTQERMWFLEQLEPGAALFNRPVAIRLTGALPADRLEAALEAVALRHEVLRAAIPAVDGRPALVIAPELRLAVAVAEVAGEPGPTRDAALLAALREEGRRPFDLARGPLVRASLFRLGREEHVLLLVFHHTVFDGTSVGVLLGELAAQLDAASGVGPAKLPPPVQFADWAEWQRRDVEARAESVLLPYWEARLAGAPHVLELPADHARPAARTFAGVERVTPLPAAVAARLAALGREHGASRFTVLLAGFAALLHRLSGEEDVLIGSPVGGRTRLEAEPLIGPLINTLVLRVELAGDPTFAALVGRCRDAVEGALAHQELPFDRLVEALQPRRDLARNPLYQVMFQLRDRPARRVTGSGLVIEEMRFDRGVAGVDLEVEVRDTEGGLECAVNVASELFEPATAERLAARFVGLLEAAAARPGAAVGKMPVLGRAERNDVLERWQGPHAWVAGSRLVHELVAGCAGRTPAGVAVESDGGACEYALLEARSNRIAHLLVARGVGRETTVGIALPRSADMVAAVLGTMKAGGCYVPLDPELPPARIDFMRRDAGVGLVLTSAAAADRHPELGAGAVALDRLGERLAGLPASPPRVDVAPDQLAYVIYTSGSTGVPKGVMIEHGGLASYVRACADRYGVRPDDRVLQFASLSYDISAQEIFLALSGGATLVLRPEGPAAASAAFLRFCGAARLTLICLPTAYWHQLAADMAALGLALPRSLRVVQIGGEAARPEALARWHRAAGGPARLVNSYGPTEATVMCTWADLGPDEARGAVLPIGRPFDNARVYVLDGAGEPAAVGVPGEIFVAGSGVGRGYFGRPDLTAERFLPDPFAPVAGARMYRTGDRGRWRHDGQLEFLGRIDAQVKIRGHRVEPGEVEAVLVGFPGVAQAAVRAEAGPDGESVLVAFLVPAPGAGLEVEEVRERAGVVLPAFMLPERVVVLAALPLNAAGKVDRAALPATGSRRGAARAAPGGEPPRTDLEREIAAIWAEVLGRGGFGPRDDFFALGGHSLRAMRVAARLRERLGVEVPVGVLFEARTVEALAERVGSLREAEGARAR